LGFNGFSFILVQAQQSGGGSGMVEFLFSFLFFEIWVGLLRILHGMNERAQQQASE
jgi:hypothetical protein